VRSTLVCTHDLIGAAVMHIHRGAAGVNGPIVFDLGNPASPVEAVWTGMTPADVADLFAGNFYVNIHTSGRPAGEIRGQIRPRTVDAFSFAMSGSQEVPPTPSPAVGICLVDLSDNATELAMQCSHNVSNFTSVHLHSGPPGVDGPVAFDLPVASSFTLPVPMSPRMVADFAAGFLYVNVHSTDFPQGAIRGQAAAGAPAVFAAGAPALSEWAMIILGFSILTIALWRLNGGD